MGQISVAATPRAVSSIAPGSGTAPTYSHVPLALGSRGIPATGESAMEVGVAVQLYIWELSDSYKLRFKAVMPPGLQTIAGGGLTMGPPGMLSDPVNVPSGVVIKESP